MPEVSTGDLVANVMAHSYGSTVIAISADGNRLLTAGDDCFAHVFQVEADGQLGKKTPIEAQSAFYSIDVHGDSVVAGMDDQTAVLYSASHPDEQDPEVILRCTLPIRCLRFSPDGSLLAVASDDMTVKIVKMNERDRPVRDLVKDLKDSVKNLCWDPRGKFLVGAICDGSMCIWESETGRIVHQGKYYDKMEPEVGPFQMDWSRDGSVIAVPGQKDLRLLDTKKWTVSKTLKKHLAPVDTVAFSPNGKYVLSSDEMGKAHVWDIDSEQIVSSFENDERLFSTLWHPKINAVVMSDALGQVFVWSGAVPKQMTSPVEAKLSIGASETKSKKTRFMDDEAQDDKEECETSGRRSRQELTEDLMDLADDHDSASLGDEDDIDNFIVDDIDNVYGSDRDRERSTSAYRKRFELSSAVAPGVQLPPIQDPFQPNSTPVRDGRCYLAYNLIGTIDCIIQDGHHSINIEFHDISSHRPISFKAIYPFTMAAMSELGAAFASKSMGKRKSDESDTSVGSVLYYRPFENWSTTSDWTAYMPDEEDITCVASSTRWIAAATSQNNLRLFSSSGVQLGIFSIPAGPVVSMAAFEDKLMLVFAASSFPGARLEFQIWNVSTRRPITSPMPLPATRIEWIGFSETGIPSIYDVNGILKACLVNENFQWLPVLDTRPLRKGRTDYYWPVSWNDSSLTAVICKAGERHPGFPRPILSEFPLSMPALNLDTPVGKLEEEMMRDSMFKRFYESESRLDESDEAKSEVVTRTAGIDKILIQLIMQACKNQKSARALDLCNLLNLDKSIELAYKIAQKNHLPQLAEKFERLLKTRRAAAERALMEEQASFEPAPLRSSESASPVQQQEQPQHSFTAAPAKKPTPIQPKRRVDEVLHATPARSTESADVFNSPAEMDLSKEKPRPAFVNPFKKKIQASPLQTTSLSDVVKVTEERKQQKKTSNSVSAAAANGNAAKKRKVQPVVSFFKKHNTAPAKEDSEKPVDTSLEPSPVREVEKENAPEKPSSLDQFKFVPPAVIDGEATQEDAAMDAETET